MDHNTKRDRRLADCMRSAQDGDDSAYVRLLEEVTPLLRQTVRRYRTFLQPADVEDLVQHRNIKGRDPLASADC